LEDDLINSGVNKLSKKKLRNRLHLCKY